MERIEALTFGHVQNERLSKYMWQIVQILTAEKQYEPQAAEQLDAAWQAFRARIRFKATPYGATLKQIDKKTDRIWRGMRAQVKLSANHPCEAIREAAAPILTIFNALPNPTALAYDLQYGALDSMLTKLQALGPDVLRRALLLEWTEEMRANVDAFMAVQNERNVAKAQVVTGETKRCRDALVATYQQIVERLNAIAILMPDEAHARINARIQQAVTDFKMSLKLAKPKASDEDDGDPESDASEDF